MDLKYTYGQSNPDTETSRKSNFSILSGECTCTYCSFTGFFYSTDMTEALRKVMHNTLVALDIKHCFLENIIAVSPGSKEDHLKLVNKDLKKLNDDNLRINLPKCQFVKTEADWLGYKFTQSRMPPLETKTSAILKLTAPKNLKQLYSCLGSVHYFGKFIPNLFQLSHPLQPLLNKYTKMSRLMNLNVTYNT